MIKKIFSLFTKKQSDATPAAPRQGILVFSHTSEVISAENLLKEHGFSVEVKGPPPELHTGCDMVIVFDLMLELTIYSVLESHELTPLDIVALHSTAGVLEPIDLYHVTDYGDWFMVRAANMKITLAKKTGVIVNISGGGCPDVPYLASRLLDAHINEAEEPRLYGKTLCSYALQKAFAEAKRLYVEYRKTERLS